MSADGGKGGLRALLGSQRWLELCAAGTGRSYRPGQYLLRQGDRGGYVLVLTDGRVRICALEPDGTQLLHALRGPGDLLGELAMPDRAARTATVVALDRCTARYLPSDAFRRFLDAVDGHQVLTEYLMAKLADKVLYRLQFARFPPARRIALLLCEVIALAQAPTEPIPVPFSQVGIADALGLARSTVAEQITALRRQGILGPGPRLVVADLRRLAGVAHITL